MSLFLEDTETLFSKQTWCIVFDENMNTEFSNVSNGYLFSQTPFLFIDSMTKPVLPRFVGPMRPLFGQYKYLFENPVQICACLKLHTDVFLKNRPSVAIKQSQTEHVTTLL